MQKGNVELLALVAPHIGSGADHAGQTVEVSSQEGHPCRHPHSIPLAVAGIEVEVSDENVGKGRGRIDGAFFNPV